MESEVYLRHIANEESHWWFKGRREIIYSIIKKNMNFNKKEILTCLPETFIDEAVKSITGWNGYRPTPLIKLNKLSKKLKLKEIYYKDESKRFHLKSFKALGGAFAVNKIANGKNRDSFQNEE